jgi:catechol 2,3-dioxygenase-like lactoylglutathione lyase family enzyme
VSSAPQLLRGAPYFPVPDVERAVAHYERVFGFRRDYVEPEFAMVSRDGFCIMLRRVEADIFAVRDRDGYALGFGQPVE